MCICNTVRTEGLCDDSSIETRGKGNKLEALAHRDVKGVRLAILRILNGLDLVVYALVGLAFVAAAVLAFAFSITQFLSGLLEISASAYHLNART